MRLKAKPFSEIQIVPECTVYARRCDAVGYSSSTRSSTTVLTTSWLSSRRLVSRVRNLSFDCFVLANVYLEEGHPGKIHQRRPSERYHAAEGLPQILQVVPIELTPELDQHTFLAPLLHPYTGHVSLPRNRNDRFHPLNDFDRRKGSSVTAFEQDF